MDIWNRARSVLCLLVTLALLPASVSARTAPKFTLHDLDGRRFNLAKALESGPVLLDFWATWCRPCVKALPRLQEIQRIYGPRGLTIVTINEDGPRNQTKVRPFLKKHDLALRVLLDLNAGIMNRYRITSLPATVLISPAGELVYFHRGYKPGDEKRLQQEIEDLLQ